jgi:hypothetical protein
MTKLKAIRVHKQYGTGPLEIQLDWDNDRSQAVLIGDDPVSVIEGLLHTAHFLQKELINGDI